jgi:multiple sugar transport system permease protein
VLATVGHRATVLLFTGFAAFPFYWMLITTFKQNRDLYVGATNTEHNPFIFNAPPTLDNLRLLFSLTLYPVWLVNTLLVGVAVVTITLALTVPAG